MQNKLVSIKEIRDALLKSIKQSKDWKDFHKSLNEAKAGLEKIQQLKHIAIFLTIVSFMSMVAAFTWTVMR